jgi:hypothetical protein
MDAFEVVTNALAVLGIVFLGLVVWAAVELRLQNKRRKKSSVRIEDLDPGLEGLRIIPLEEVLSESELKSLKARLKQNGTIPGQGEGPEDDLKN